MGLVGRICAEWAMLVPDCILLFTAFCCYQCYSLILVEKKANGACLHIHTAAPSTWFYVRCVEKFAIPTPKQKLRNVAATNQSLPLMQSCGGVKKEKPTKKEKQRNAKFAAT